MCVLPPTHPPTQPTWCRELTTKAKLCCQRGLQVSASTEVTPFCRTGQACSRSPPGSDTGSGSAPGSRRERRLLAGLSRPKKVLRLQWSKGVGAQEKGKGGEVEHDL